MQNLTGETKRPGDSGFSLIELAIVLVVVGIVAAFFVPGAITMSQGMQLNASANAIAGQLRLARSKAMSTGIDQMMHFSPDSLGSDYHIHSGATIPASWKFPAGITYTTNAFQSVTMTSSGRASTSTFIVLRDRRGDVDTVSVEASGLVTVY
jgi:prepilin-type N-terminal cleavage/methylation domain-containing protein